MAPQRRMKRLAALVNTAPETLAEVIGDVLRDTVKEMRMYEPGTGGRIAGDIRRHRKTNPGGWSGRQPHAPLPLGIS